MIRICFNIMRGGGSIGRLLIMEFVDNESSTFDEVIELLKKHPNFQKCEMQMDSKLSFPGIEIYPERRKVYCNGKEVHLTAKEYRLLWLLAVNKGQVLTYQQIYEKVWGDFSSGGESTAIGYHICNLRDKLYDAFPDAPFEIRCVREVGYCFEVNVIQSI
ncbi:transcriptional regulator [Lachnospiraceae bacterium WCA-9-b2]|uniref:Transcriptional regulator n=2 Tax=Sporofaciens musculi TaxID=2681861 RepID=A0A7X3SIM0_9FIRM|nr:transcriptional regulator [Sporofaciens musculi]